MKGGVRVTCLSQALSPITQMRGVSGNEALIGRQRLISGQEVPVVTGNSLRNRCVRQPGSNFLYEALGLSELGLTLPQLGFFFNGGALTESTGREDTKRIAEMRRLLPQFALLGGSLPDQILSGGMDVSFAWLVCEETRSVVDHMLPNDWPLPEESMRSAENLVDDYTYVRGRVATTAPHLVPENEAEIVLRQREERGVAGDFADGDYPSPRGRGKDDKSTQMIFSGQQVCTGALFVHDFLLRSGNPLQLGCLLQCLVDWQSNGGTVGGGSCRGNGRLKTWAYMSTDYGIGTEGLIEQYEDHVLAHRDDAVRWILDAFAEKKSEKKAKK